jgi:Ethanolamine utilization protein EutJ (predicted chaperonin)
VPQHQQFDVFHVQAAAAAEKRPKQRPKRQVEKGEDHAADPPNLAPRSSDTNIGTLQGSSDSIKVVKDLYAALNAKDVDKAMKYVADTAVFVNPNGTFRGAEDVRHNLVESAFVTFEHSNFRTKGGRVVYDFKIKDDVSGRVIEEGTDGLTIVEDGKIVFDGTERTEQRR